VRVRLGDESSRVAGGGGCFLLATEEWDMAAAATRVSTKEARGHRSSDGEQHQSPDDVQY
jgi:hypothetical protein